MSLAALAHDIATTPELVSVTGKVVEISAHVLVIKGLSSFVRIGDGVRFDTVDGPQLAEVVKIDEDILLAKPFGSRLRVGVDAVASRCPPPRIRPHSSWRGRIVDALGRPLDGIGPLVQGPSAFDPYASAPNALTRARVSKPIVSGVAAIDFFTPLCAGQRIGVFAGSGVGKTSLLSMLMGSEAFDTIVVALVGERGREVRETIEETLAGRLSKAVVVVATSDESPMMRRQAPATATAIAEAFRNVGQTVLLVVDSITRYAHALREVALAAGEPPVARGYPPTVFTSLPHLLERAGPGIETSGTITGVYSVLVDGDDQNEPVADCIRGTIDGHIVLDRAIAHAGRYPAVDPLASLSRLSHLARTREQEAVVREMLRFIFRFEETKDLRSLNAYKAGSDAELDRAVQIVPRLYELMLQSPSGAPRSAIFDDVAAICR